MLESFLFEKSNNTNNLQNQASIKNTVINHSSQKCDAVCEARSIRSAPHLWLRKNVFYCRIELPRVNGKRRYKRFSLHTNNYYEAKTMITQREYINHTVLNVHKLFDKMLLKAWPDGFDKPLETKDFNKLISTYSFVQKVAPKIDPKDFKQVSLQIDSLSEHLDQLEPFQRLQLDLMRKMLDQLADISSQLRRTSFSGSSVIVPTSPKYTLEYVLSIMLQKKEICSEEKDRKRNTLTKMFNAADLTLKSEYDDYNTPEKISMISDYIQNRKDLQGDAKRKYVRYLQEFMKTANKLNPECYKLNLMDLLPDIKKTAKSAHKPHLPYSQKQLLNMFDPKYNFFIENPDIFWMCVISLFTGARRNAASTLQFKDIVKQEGLDCIHFTEEGSDIKKFKNEASIRFVPIHRQLIELGFLDFVKNRQKQLKAQDTDFIFPNCKTSGGKFNDKLLTRTLTKFLLEIKVKGAIKDGYDFHSFRKNASLAMQNAHILEAFINDIIGWESKTIMLHHYSNHTLGEIRSEMDKFEYDFLKPHFAIWKEIMSNKN